MYTCIRNEENAKSFLMKFDTCSDFNSLFCMFNSFHVNLELPNFNENIELSSKELDFNANCLLLNYSKYCSQFSYLAYQSSGDGSCFFHSLSLALYGSENFSFRLRLFTLIYVLKNYNHLKCNNPTTRFRTLSTYLGMSLEDSILRCSKIIGFSCRLTAFCASKALAINIHLIYPPIYGLADPHCRFPIYFENSLPNNDKSRLVTIVWTTGSSIVQPNGFYLFNHFCPVFKVEDRFCNIPDSHLAKVSMLKDHLFHPFQNTNHPCSFDSLLNYKLKANDNYSNNLVNIGNC